MYACIDVRVHLHAQPLPPEVGDAVSFQVELNSTTGHRRASGWRWRWTRTCIHAHISLQLKREYDRKQPVCC